MAEAEVKHYLTCVICLETFTEPVSLSCHHSFCRSCLQEHWAQQKKKKSRYCPVCKRKSSKGEPGVNFALKELSDSLRQKQESQEEPTAQTQQEQWSVCPSHPQVPSLFCLDRVRAVCALCEFSKHTEHTVVSVEEAEKRLKEQLQSQIQTLKEQRQSWTQLEKNYEQIQQHSEKQAEQCERQITAVFERMRRHLQEEQDRAVSALRQEQSRQAQTMGPQLQSLRKTLSSLNNSIQELEKQLETHSQDFLRTYRPALPPSPEPLPQTPTGLLLNQAKVLGNLGFRAWSRMRRVVSFSPVILDSNTARGWLHLSEDLSGVTKGDIYQDQIPDNPERFTNGPDILGSEGFISGTHQWDVEVGDHPDWIIGVANESVDRKGEAFVSPEYGIWCLLYRDGKYSNGCNKPVKVQKSPERIRVKLDCDGGKVSFYDADHMTHLYTHTDTFTEKMFPYFSIGGSKDAKTKELRICPTSGPCEEMLFQDKPERHENLDFKQDSPIDQVKHTSSSQIDQVKHTSSSQIDQVKHTSSSQIDQVKHTSSSQIDQVKHTSSSQIDQVKHTSSSQIDRSGQTHFILTDRSGQTHFILTDPSGQTHFILTDRSGQTHFILTDRSGQTHFILTDPSGQTHFTLTDRSGQTHFILTDRSGQTDFILTDRSGQTHFILTDRSGQTHFILTDRSGQTHFILTDRSGQTHFILTDRSGRHRVTDSEDLSKMAEAEVKHFLTCVICLETFTEPVSLSCHHSFCRSCLQEHWAQQKSRSCPVCRRKWSKGEPDVNFALKQLSESFRQKQESQEEPTAQTQQEQWSVCPSHPQVPSLFCLDEVRAVCALCEFSKHTEHTVAEQCERQITAVFERMRRHLQEEQDRAVSALRQEQSRQAQTMGPQLQSLRKTLSSLNNSIQELEKQLETHSQDFLRTYRPALPPSPEPLPQTPTGLLLNQAKVLGNLGFRAWSRMRRVVSFSPVILDSTLQQDGSICLRI
ncbi:hypothetical protein WMY93_019024 [Mugilogobius chulae]|uniref:Uncharacterized protein n=1 Tax=Mugilogobius chulae TaxID=88201 RepID=A0AAW0ND43_9GOBI